MQVNRKSVGLALRFARETAGLTLVEFANILGTTKSSLSRVEHGERDLTYAESLEMSEALKLSADDFRSLVKNFEREQLENLPDFTKAANEAQRLAIGTIIKSRFNKTGDEGEAQ